LFSARDCRAGISFLVFSNWPNPFLSLVAPVVMAGFVLFKGNFYLHNVSHGSLVARPRSGRRVICYSRTHVGCPGPLAKGYGNLEKTVGLSARAWLHLPCPRILASSVVVMRCGRR
jgi:hypothetical protein